MSSEERDPVINTLPQENVIDSTEEHLSNGKSTSNGNEDITKPAVAAGKPKHDRKSPPTEKNEEPKAKNTKLDETETESVKSEGAASSSVRPASARRRRENSSKQDDLPPDIKRATKIGASSTQPTVAKERNVTSKNGKTNAKLETFNKNEFDGSSSSSAQPALSTKEQKATSSRKELPPATMDFKQNSIVALHLIGKSNIEIRRGLHHMNLSEKFVYRTIKRFDETGSIKKRYGGGRRCTATTLENVNKVRNRLYSNPELSSATIASELNISDRSVRRILKNKLKHEVHTKLTHNEAEAESASSARGWKTISSKKKLSPAAKRVAKKESSKSSSSAQPVGRPVNQRRKRGGSEVAEDDEIDEKKSKSTPKKAAPPKKGSKMNSTETLYNEMDFSSDKTFNLKISSWNVAGLRAWISKGGQDYVKYEKPDIICLQEIKCISENVPEEACFPGYHPYGLCRHDKTSIFGLYRYISIP